MKPLLAFLALLAFPSILPAESEEKPANPVQHLDAKAANTLLSSGDKTKIPVVLDIRTPEEFKEGHLGNAVNVDFLADTFEAEVAKLDRDKPYLVHCRSGGRSTKSLEIFKKLGFKNILHLDGGYIAWTEAGQAVVK